MKPSVGMVAAATAGLALGASVSLLRANPGEPAAQATPPTAAAGAQEIALSDELQKRAQLTTQVVGKRTLAPSVDLVGTVDFDPNAVADVGGRIAGRITRLMVNVGDRVTEEQPLLELDSNELGEALAALLSAKANLIAAENQAKRETALGEKQLSSATMVESARAQAKALSAEVAGAERRLWAMGLTPLELSTLGRGEGQGPKRITLRAPIAGEVVERYAMLGQVVDPTHPVLRIADLGRLWVELALFERDLARVHVGDAVQILSETYPDKKFTGKVAYVNATVDQATRTATVRIEVPNPERLLRPGQFVHAQVESLGKGEPVLAIPREAVIQIEGQFAVFVERSSGRYVARPIEVGRADGDVIEVKRGLIEGERVVVEGGFVLKSELQR